MQTNHGYTFQVWLNNDENGTSYFDGHFWGDFATCYLLDPGTKLLFDIAQPGLIIHVTLPDKIHPWIHQSLVFFQFTSYVHPLTNVSDKLTNHYLYHKKQQIWISFSDYVSYM